MAPLKYADFLKRLHSFQACYWFAKPANISPLICAKHGWKNEGPNKLYCSFCKVELLHNDSESVDQFVSMLSTAHKDYCGWKDCECPTAFNRYFIIDGNANNPTSLYNSVLKRLLASSSSIRHVSDSALIINCIELNTGCIALENRSLEEFVKFNSNVKSEHLKECEKDYQKCVKNISNLMRYAQGLECIDMNMIDNITAFWKHSTDPLIAEISKRVAFPTDSHCDENQTKVFVKFLLLTMFGWDVVCGEAHNSEASTIATPHLHCSTCNRSLSLSSIIGDSIEVVAKNVLNFNMLNEHKNYCPCVYVLQEQCGNQSVLHSSELFSLSGEYPGFVQNMAAFAGQLGLNESAQLPMTEINMSEEFDRIRKILQ